MASSALLAEQEEGGGATATHNPSRSAPTGTCVHEFFGVFERSKFEIYMRAGDRFVYVG